jgi:lysophospholipase L1-like esterase
VFNDTTVLGLVRGTNVVDGTTGANTFTPGGGGPHYFVRKVMSDADLSTYLDSVVSASPTVYLGQVATKSRIPANLSTTNKQFNSRSHHKARCTITSLQIELPNWYWARKGDLLEHGSGGTITYKASVEYPAGTFTAFTFSASSSVVVANNTSVLSDAATVTIPDGASFWIRVFAVAATAIVFVDGETVPSSRQCDTGNGEAMAFAASGLSDQTTSGTITATVSTDAAPIFAPTAIVAYTTRPSVLLIGDSRDWGYYDAFDSSGDLGEIARSIGPSYGYINAGSAGDNMPNFISSHTNRVALKQYCSHVLTENGINDLRFGGAGLNQSAATAFANMQTLWGYFAGKTIFASTISPNSASSDGWATTGNQTVNANAANIAAYNDLLRATPSPLAGYFEVADTVESARNSGKWKASQTSDGLHPNPTGYQTIKTSGAVDPTRLRVV